MNDHDLPDYNAEGKMLTYKQHMEKKRKYDTEKNKKLERFDGEKPGKCRECGTSRFQLRCEEGKIIRTCNNEKCRKEVIF